MRNHTDSNPSPLNITTPKITNKGITLSFLDFQALLGEVTKKREWRREKRVTKKWSKSLCTLDLEAFCTDGGLWVPCGDHSRWPPGASSLLEPSANQEKKKSLCFSKSCCCVSCGNAKPFFPPLLLMPCSVSHPCVISNYCLFLQINTFVVSAYSSFFKVIQINLVNCSFLEMMYTLCKKLPLMHKMINNSWVFAYLLFNTF